MACRMRVGIKGHAWLNRHVMEIPGCRHSANQSLVKHPMPGDSWQPRDIFGSQRVGTDMTSRCATGFAPAQRGPNVGLPRALAVVFSLYVTSHSRQDDLVAALGADAGEPVFCKTAKEIEKVVQAQLQKHCKLKIPVDVLARERFSHVCSCSESAANVVLFRLSAKTCWQIGSCPMQL